MKVFMTGSTGAIGRHALNAVVKAGHDVFAMVRSDEKAELVKIAGATPIAISLFDEDALSAELIGYDAVVNLATAIPPNSDFMKPGAFEMNDRIRCEGSAILVNAALKAGVPRFIQESVSMIYQDSGDEWIDETSKTARFPFAVGNHAAESNP